MIRRLTLAMLGVAMLCICFSAAKAQAQQRAYGQAWGGNHARQDWDRFYHYPYVYYPQNFRGNEYYRSSRDMYHRYPSEMRTPVYNKQWHNYFPEGRRYHSGHHFILDQF